MVSQPIVGVTTRKRRDELKWCRNTVFDVVTRFGKIGVTTWPGLLRVAT